MSEGMNEFVARGRKFLERLNRAKTAARADFEWYRYHSLTNVTHISELLGNRHDYILDLAREKGVLDAGCADGDLSFFFESLGCDVVAIDHPAPNHNGMRGVRLLKQILNSKVTVREVDLDSQFTVPDRRFGLSLFLGALYHVKNPFYILETLAKCSEYCLLSTRVARRFPHIGRVPEQATLGYLLDAEELNADDSNFWIFSHAGLRLLLKRTRWSICEYRSAGATSDSDADSLENDERAFCLLRSHYGLANVELVSGWHAAEHGGWRWTERVFSVRVKPDAGFRPSRVTMKVFIAPELLEQMGTIRMDISCDGKKLEPFIFEEPGLHTVTRAVDPQGIVRFELDRAIAADTRDTRERGVIVSDITFE